ncbi:hypothetical protein ONS95_008121 [Cadophora gregata]|uniref:uncharacterized protein n=1 Tax=Cadophora gregata TaxID=51156 RepID=UPI0026DBC506|nr:uncharacterized protein ONS95_008121 [Cadophora gregata]KAK0119272.1 hypothetical protein ONS96_012331 [Cadophora gregata f. sp. sojae]KAK0126526.1 hypothetical protein ONS95_008121 [Cadophora gregata]
MSFRDNPERANPSTETPQRPHTRHLKFRKFSSKEMEQPESEGQPPNSDQIWSRSGGKRTCTLYRLPTEIRHIAYEYIETSDEYLGKHPHFLAALRPDKFLYLEFLTFFQKKTTYVLDEYKCGSLDLFCSMRDTVLASILKLKVVYLQYHEADERLDKSQPHKALLGWKFDKDSLSKAINVVELTFDLSFMYRNLFGASFVSHIPDFPQLTRFNLVISEHGRSGQEARLLDLQEVTDLDQLLDGVSDHFHTIMPKISRVSVTTFEDEPRNEFVRVFDSLPSDIRDCLTWLWHRDGWGCDFQMQKVLAHSRLKKLPMGGGCSDVTCLGVSETWFWVAAKGRTLVGK